MSALVVNLFGGPGTGKSTIMAETFAKMKWAKINCEMATEYAKSVVWKEAFKVLKNQTYVFGKQYDRIFSVIDQVDVVITDSPILLSVYYDQGATDGLKELVLSRHEGMDTLNIMLRRTKDYNPAGRMQTEDEAKDIDNHVEDMLKEFGIEYVEVNAVEDAAARHILELVKERLYGC